MNANWKAVARGLGIGLLLVASATWWEHRSRLRGEGRIEHERETRVVDENRDGSAAGGGASVAATAGSSPSHAAGGNSDPGFVPPHVDVRRSAQEWAGIYGAELARAQAELRKDSLLDGLYLTGAGATETTEGVARILEEAGVPEHDRLLALRTIQGHLKRLDLFAEFAAETMESRKEGDEAVRGIGTRTETEGGKGDVGAGETEPGPFAATFARRLFEYEQYVRRDLSLRLGIADPGVADRLLALAYGRTPRPLEPGPFRVPPGSVGQRPSGGPGPGATSP